MRDGFVYILSNKKRNVLYIGVTNDLKERVYQHKTGDGSKFTSKYNCHYLVFYEYHKSIVHAIEREKQLKNWHRDWKLNLIKEQNPTLRDLYNEIQY